MTRYGLDVIILHVCSVTIRYFPRRVVGHTFDGSGPRIANVIKSLGLVRPEQPDTLPVSLSVCPSVQPRRCVFPWPLFVILEVLNQSLVVVVPLLTVGVFSLDVAAIGIG